MNILYLKMYYGRGGIVVSASGSYAIDLGWYKGWVVHGSLSS